MAKFYTDQQGNFCERIGKYGKSIVKPSQKFLTDINIDAEQKTKEDNNQRILNELKETEPSMNRILENVFKWLITEGYPPKPGELELIYKREKLREGLKK